MSDATSTASSEPTSLMGGDPAPAPAAAPAAAPAPAANAPAAEPAKPAAPNAEPAKPGEGAKDGKDAKPTGAPEKYEDFTLPEGVKLDEPVMGEFTALAKELNLPQDAAQKLVSLGAKMQLGNIEQMQTVVTAQSEKWAGDSKVDKEFGGDKFDENLAVALRARDQFATPELKAALNASGMGNHPEVIRFFYRVGQAISQDGFVPGRSSSGAKKSDADVIYGTTH